MEHSIGSIGGIGRPESSTPSVARSGQHSRRWKKPVGMALVVLSLLANVYLIGLLNHSAGSYAQLKAGGTAAYPGVISKSSAGSITVDTQEGKQTVSLADDTPYAIFPKNYQTLVPIGLPSSRDDIVVGTTEASVSAQLPYLSSAKALRVNLVSDSLLTGKVIEVKDSQVTFKGYAATEYVDETRTFAPNITFLKLGADGTLTAITKADVKVDQGMYAYLDKPADQADAQIVKLVVADFTSTTE